MFVRSNTIPELQKYFNSKLEDRFSAQEIKLMFNLALEERLQMSREELLLNRDQRLSESDLLHIRSIAHRLLDNEPFQYIMGETEFYGLKIKCDKRALIPRPETEELVVWIAEEIKNETPTLVDFCSGSGCIALALQKNFPQASITGIELSEDALNLSRKNAQLNQLPTTFVQGDVLHWDESLLEKDSLDVLVSNPPYIPEKDKAEMHENVLRFEPHLALFVSNDDPFIFYRKLAEIGQEKLKKGGELFFEIHEKYADGIQHLLTELNFHTIETREDLQGKTRMIRAQK